MARKFEMVEKGWEYRTDGYKIKKGYDRKCVTNVGFITLNRYAYVRYWAVYPNNENTIYKFSKLSDAKAFIISRD